MRFNLSTSFHQRQERRQAYQQGQGARESTTCAERGRALRTVRLEDETIEVSEKVLASWRHGLTEHDGVEAPAASRQKMQHEIEGLIDH